MKTIVATFLIIAAFSAAGVGFFMMDHPSTDHSNCIATISSGINCAKIMDPIDLSVTHTSFFSQFTNTIVGQSIMLALLFMAALLAVSFGNILLPSSVFSRAYYARAPDLRPESQFHSWFSLKEHSPSF